MEDIFAAFFGIESSTQLVLGYLPRLRIGMLNMLSDQKCFICTYLRRKLAVVVCIRMHGLLKQLDQVPRLIAWNVCGGDLDTGSLQSMICSGIHVLDALLMTRSAR